MAYAEKIESFGDTNCIWQIENLIDVLHVIPEILVKLFLVTQVKKISWTNIIGCIPDPTPTQCKFGCNNCDSKFWKDTPRMRTHVKEMQKWREQQ